MANEFARYNNGTIIREPNFYRVGTDTTHAEDNLEVKGPRPWADVRAFGAKGDGTTDDTTAISNAIAAAPAGGVIFFPVAASYYRVTSALTIGKSLTLRGFASEIRQATSGANMFSVSAGVSGARFKGLKLVGKGASSSEQGISAAGSFASPIVGIRIEECELESWGGDGIVLSFVNDFFIGRNRITNVGLSANSVEAAAIYAVSSARGELSRNVITTVNGQATFGIDLTRSAGLESNFPRCSDITVVGNLISSVFGAAAFSTAGGRRIAITANTIYNCSRGFRIDPSSDGSGFRYAPLDIVVAGNVIDSGVTDGSKGIGISFTGAIDVVGSPNENATGSITGNVVRGHGQQSVSTSGGVFLQATEGLVVTGNTIVAASPHGIIAYSDNYDANLSGNNIVDPWSNTAGVGQAVGIYLADDKNTAVIADNSLGKDGKSATYVLTSGITVTGFGGNAAVVGVNRSEAGTYITDTAGKVSAPLPRRVSINGGAEITKHYCQTYAWNIGSLADGASAGSSFSPVTGVNPGDIAYASHSALGAYDMVISAFVDNANSVRVVIRNVSGASRTINGTVRINVWQYT